MSACLKISQSVWRERERVCQWIIWLWPILSSYVIISLGGLPKRPDAIYLASLLTSVESAVLSNALLLWHWRRQFLQAGRSQHHIILTSCFKQLHSVNSALPNSYHFQRRQLPFTAWRTTYISKQMYCHIFLMDNINIVPKWFPNGLHQEYFVWNQYLRLRELRETEELAYRVTRG